MPTAVVRVPLKPPVVFLAGLALGLGLDRAFPDALPPIIQTPLGPRLLLAAPLAIGGWALMRMSRKELGKHGVHPRFRPVNSLVRSGPFTISRNPMYVAAAACAAAVTLAANSYWLALAMLAPSLAYLELVVIPREEQALAQAFGPEFAAYCQHTPRWLLCLHHRWLRR